MELGKWTKSKKSSANGTCVEILRGFDHVAVRDSKDPTGLFLTFTHPEWLAFTEGVKAGEFDNEDTVG